MFGDAWNIANKPFDAAAGAINYVADQSGLTNAANNALVYWSNLAFDPHSSWFQKTAGSVGGVLSALAACDNAGATALTLAGGTGAGVVAGGKLPWSVRILERQNKGGLGVFTIRDKRLGYPRDNRVFAIDRHPIPTRDKPTLHIDMPLRGIKHWPYER